MAQTLTKPTDPQPDLAALMALLGIGTSDNDINSRADNLIADARTREASPVEPPTANAAPAPAPVSMPAPNPQRTGASSQDALAQFLDGGHRSGPDSMPPNVPLQLASLRDKRIGELEDQKVSSLRAASQGTPGTPTNPSFQHQVSGQQAGAADAILQMLKGEAAADPYTGTAATAKTHATQDTIDKSSLANQEPMIGQQHHLEDVALQQKVAPITEQNKGNLAVAHEQGQSQQAVAQTHADAVRDAAYAKAGGVKLNNQEQQLVDAAYAISNLGEPLLKQMETKYPGIAQDPTKYGGAMDAINKKFGKGWYSFGGMTADDPIFQSAATIEAWGLKALASGRINHDMMNIIIAHLPQPGFSVGANYDRLSRLLRQVLPAQLKGIGQGHAFDPANPTAGFPGSTGPNPDDPSTWERVPQ